MTTPVPQEVPIVFTGEVDARSYVCRVGGALVTLTGAELEVFVDLLGARLSTEGGLSQLPSIPRDNKNLKHQMIHRLRRAIDEALGAGAGRRLIVGGPRATYYLDVPRANVSIHPRVAELAPHHLSIDAVGALLSAAAAIVSEP